MPLVQFLANVHESNQLSWLTVAKTNLATATRSKDKLTARFATGRIGAVNGAKSRIQFELVWFQNLDFTICGVSEFGIDLVVIKSCYLPAALAWATVWASWFTKRLLRVDKFRPKRWVRKTFPTRHM